ncbi:FAD:protein FMN transferase [Ethanoligenens harbinense]|uniref:FAD:protein FMN transferase n=1 Tax=Ethanoligenens harbinense (strain DSM 18485 / JCM 12961 / CGMCC 1.5033 / YUAN-3) TaxID=663278 RepID=E6U2Y8_ETHHY|nr:FAD:protein FMN transferase [Ethanoligenens harbinense]ADU26355.1 ApbE family lipoprotein [Ethanoligenens harbinense YUAN-3]
MQGFSQQRDALHCRFLSLGTLNEIDLFAEAADALAMAEKRVREIDDCMSVFKPDSDIFRLNAFAGRKAVELHPETLALLALAKTIHAESRGAFDITVRPLTKLWAIEKNRETVPAEREIARARKLVDSRKLVCDAKHARAFLKRSGQAVDLGGIAKGYAADEVKRILSENGVQNALINLGGNIAAVGTRPDGSPWHIGIQNPAAARGTYIAVLSIADCSVVTSGSNERFFIRDGVRYHHILDPRTGWPVQNGLLSVTVVCRRSVIADALSTALFAGGMRYLPLLRQYDAEAVIATERGELYATPGLSGRLEIVSDQTEKRSQRHA